MNKYKKILTSGLMVLGTCLSLVACNMGGDNDSGNSPSSKGHEEKIFENAVEAQSNSILLDIADKLTNHKNHFATSSKADMQGRYTPQGKFSNDPGTWFLLNPEYSGEKDNLIYGVASANFGMLTGYGSGDEVQPPRLFQVPIIITFDKSKNMLYSSQNSGFDSGIAEDLYGCAYDYDFSLTGLFPWTLKNGNNYVCRTFFNHDTDNNSFGSPDLWAAGYYDIVSILPNSEGNLTMGQFQGNLSFLNAKITFMAYRYGYKDVSKDWSDPGYRHFWTFTIDEKFDEKTNTLEYDINNG